MERLLGLQSAQLIMVFAVFLIAEGLQRAIFLDVALTLAIMSFASSLVFIRFLERWL